MQIGSRVFVSLAVSLSSLASTFTPICVPRERSSLDPVASNEQIYYQKNSAPLEQMVGNWKNQDAATTYVTRIEVRLQDGQFLVHEWGKCHPTDCDWGEARASISGHSLLVTWKHPRSDENQEITAPRQDRLTMIARREDRTITSDYVRTE